MAEIVIIGDAHDEQERLTGVLELVAGAPADLTLLVGDLGADPPWMSPARETERERHDDSVRVVVARVRSALDCPVVFVPGNHDLPQPVADVEGINCDDRWVDAAGLKIVGLGGAGPTRFGFPYEWSEAQAETRLERLFEGARDSADILLCHTPPAGTGLDRTRRGQHVGSNAVRRRLAASPPRLFVCGHIHESWGVETVEGVVCINAGALGEPEGQEIAWRVSWSDGAPRRIVSLRRTSSGDVETRDWI